MVKALTLEELKALGLTDEKAAEIIAKQNETKPRAIFWRFKATEADALKVAEAFPELAIMRMNWKK